MKSSHFFLAVSLSCVAFVPFAQAFHPSKCIGHIHSGDASLYVIRQKDIPITIQQPGEYILEKNISYNGAGAAITIAADNVTLNVKNFSLQLTNPKATGIVVNGVSEIVIKSDAIINTSKQSQTGNGIRVSNANNVLIENISTENHFNGLSISHSSDVSILHSQFLNPTNTGAIVIGSTNVQFDGCRFAGSAKNGLRFTGANQDCSLLNSEFPSAQFSNLLVQRMKGMNVDNCSFTNTSGDPSKANLVQYGDVGPLQIATNVIFTNCTIVNRPAPGGNTSPEGLALYNVSGVLVDSCIIDIDNTGTDPAADLSSIHVGNGSGVQVGSNVTIRNTISEGPAMDGFYPDIGSTNVVMDNCLVSNALKDGIFIAGSSACVVQNCSVVNNKTNGIFIGEVGSNNAVLNNVVTQNGFDPIVSSVPPIGNGIAIASDSSYNLIQNNQVFTNAVANINDNGTNDVIVDNTTF